MLITVETISARDADDRGITLWPVSRRGARRFRWHYDATEICYLASGRAMVETEDGTVEIERGDLVTLPSGLDCVWVIREPIVKHYRIVNGTQLSDGLDPV